ncbi:MAG: BamA/TamA family outer membrane protein [Bacteroidales bacterium]
MLLTRSLIISLILGVIYVPATGQEISTTVSGENDSICLQRDLKDVLMEALHKTPKNKKEKSGSVLVVPIVGSNPAIGFMVGVGGQAAFKMPGCEDYSSFSGSAQFTTKSQKIFMLKNNVYTRDNRFYLEGDWRFLVYSQSTYGLGTSAPEGGLVDYQYNLFGVATTQDSLAQPMKFNFARFHQSVSFNLYKGLMAGIGYEFDYYFKIKDEKLRIGPVDTLFTSHLVYNLLTGFETERYLSSLINFHLVLDTRDNIMNAYRGVYARAAYKVGPKFLGNTRTGMALDFEWRSFHSLSRRNPRHLVSFWMMGNFTRKGDFPYMILPASAYDQRGRNSRGYTQGRFRGPNLVYAEAEYRFPVTPCGGILGGVLFINATSTDNPLLGINLFDVVRPGVGTGLRVMIDKASRMNLAVDVGWGYKSFGFYLNVTETF